MKFKFHHTNLCTENVPRISEFYRTLFGLDPVHGYVRVDGSNSYGGSVDFVTDVRSSSPRPARCRSRLPHEALRQSARPRSFLLSHG